MATTTNYILRDIDPSVWKAFRARATTEGRSLRWILIHLIQRYIKHGLTGDSK
jgi:hypothetical protein